MLVRALLLTGVLAWALFLGGMQAQGRTCEGSAVVLVLPGGVGALAHALLLGMLSCMDSVLVWALPGGDNALVAALTLLPGRG